MRRLRGATENVWQRLAHPRIPQGQSFLLNKAMTHRYRRVLRDDQ